MKNKSHKKMLNKIGPKTDLWAEELRIKLLPMSCILNLFWFFLCDLSNSLVSVLMSQYWISMHLIFAIKRSRWRQSNALERSVRSAPNLFWLSTADFYFSSIEKRHCWALKPFLKPHWNIEKNGSKYLDICQNINVSYIFEIYENILTRL